MKNLTEVSKIENALKAVSKKVRQCENNLQSEKNLLEKILKLKKELKENKGKFFYISKNWIYSCGHKNKQPNAYYFSPEKTKHSICIEIKKENIDYIFSYFQEQILGVK